MALPTPSPNVSLQDGLQAAAGNTLDILYGEQGKLILEFKEKQQNAVGYGPWLELLVDAPNEHVNIQNAQWGSRTLAPLKILFEDGDNDGVYELNHPITGQTITGQKGGYLLLWNFPVGSYQYGSPPLRLDIPVEVQTTKPDVFTNDVQLQAGGGYRYGSDPRDNDDPANPLNPGGSLNPGGPFDPVIVDPTPASGKIHPTAVRLEKETQSPEDETATGPNFPRSWRLDVDVADGQTIDPFRLRDTLPNGIHFLADQPDELNASNASYKYNPARPQPPQPIPGQTIGASRNQWSVDFFGLHGFTKAKLKKAPLQDVDLRSRLDFYIPDLLGESGVARSFKNTANFEGVWSNIPVPSDQSGSADDRIVGKAIAIQKFDDQPEQRLDSGDVLPGAVLPGETIEFTLNFQISDYYAFGNLKIADLLQDGLSYLAGTSEIKLMEEGQELSTAPLAFEDKFIQQKINLQAGDDQLVFQLSDWLKNHAVPTAPTLKDGLLIGGKVVGDFGPTKGTITFKATVDDTYVYGDTVKSEDRLRNDVSIAGDLYRYKKAKGLFEATGQRVQDDSSERVRIEAPSFKKQLVARNQRSINNNQPGDPVFAPGDSITYRLTATFPTGDLQGVTIEDWLPTPGFDLALDAASGPASTAFEQGSKQFPDPGRFVYGDQHGTSSQTSQNQPALVNNQIQIDSDPSSGVNKLKAVIQDQGDTSNQTTTIDLLYTVKATSAVMADRLDQTNLAQLKFESTRGKNDQTDHSIGPAFSIGKRLSPDLKIRKGVVSATSDRPNSFQSIDYAPKLSIPAGISFDPVGTASSSSPFQGIISSNLISKPDQQSSSNRSTGEIKKDAFNSNVRNLDAGDRVRFVMLIENIGTSYKGAFNLQLRDDLPAGLIYPSNGYFSIVDGSGQKLDYVRTDGSPATPDDFFNSTIQLVDPGVTPSLPPDGERAGAIDGYDPISGHNIAVITFDLEVADDAYQAATKQNSLDLVNQGVIEDYANMSNPGQNTFLPGSLFIEDTADLSLLKANVEKEVIATSESHTAAASVSDPDLVTIGEIVRYRIKVDLPEGDLGSIKIEDQLPPGLSYLGNPQLGLIGSASDFRWTEQDDLSNYIISGVDQLDAQSLSHQWHDPVQGRGRRLAWTFNGFENNNRNDKDVESIVLAFNVLVDNNLSDNQAGRKKTNRANFKISGVNAGQSPPVKVKIVEPQLSLSKQVSPADGLQAGEKFTYTIELKNDRSVDAFDVSIVDQVSGFSDQLDLSNLQIISQPGGWIDDSNLNGANAGKDKIELRGDLPAGTSIQFTYEAELLPSFLIGSDIKNTALAGWTSLPGGRGSQQNPTNSVTPEDSGALRGERTYKDDAEAVVTSAQLKPLKTIDSSSEKHTSGSQAAGYDLAIGEIVRFRLELNLPHGRLNNLQIQDVLPQGFALVDHDQTARFGVVVENPLKPGITASGGIDLDQSFLDASVSAEPVKQLDAPKLSFDQQNQVLTWGFGDLENQNRGRHQDKLVLEFNARVLNELVNQDGSQVKNKLTVLHDVGQQQRSELAQSTSLNIVEPDIVLNKAVSTPSSGLQAGDSVTFTLTLTNQGNATAFDLIVDDLLQDLGPAFDLQVPLDLSQAPGAVDLSSQPNRLQVKIPELAVGDQAVIAYTGVLTADEVNNSVYTNTAVASWSSLPGAGTIKNPTGSTNASLSEGTQVGERNGANGTAQDPANVNPLNNYQTSADASIATNLLGLTKTIVATSEPASVASSSEVGVLIGEVVTYRIQIDLPGGTSNNVRLDDLIPAGLTLIPGRTRLALASEAVDDLSSTELADPSTYFVKAVADNTSLRAVTPFPDDGLGRWTFGDLINRNTTTQSTESLILEFDAVVVNEASNQQGQAVSANSIELNADNRRGGFKLSAASKPLLIQEPNLQLVKTSDRVCLNPFDSNAIPVISYGLTVSNQGDAPAFDLILDDQLPVAANAAGLVLDPGSISGLVPGLQIRNSGEHQLSLEMARLNPGESFSVTYQASLSDDPTLPGRPDSPDGSLDNTAKLIYSSLPGERGSNNLTPGASGAVDGERNGDGLAANDYQNLASTTVNVSPHLESEGPLVVDEDDLPGAGAEGPNASVSQSSVSTLQLFAGSFPINSAALLHGGSQTDLDQRASNLKGIVLTDANGNTITKDGQGEPIVWNFRKRTLEAVAGSTTLLRLEFPKLPSLQPGEIADVPIQADVLAPINTHASAADDAYSSASAGGGNSWDGAVRIDGLQLAVDEKKKDRSNHCNDALIPLDVWVLDDIPDAPLQAGETQFCANSGPQSGPVVIQPGADNGFVRIWLDADGDGYFEQSRTLVDPAKSKSKKTTIRFAPSLIPGQGVLELEADARSGQGTWTFSPLADAPAGSQTFQIAVEDADGDRTAGMHTLVFQSEPKLDPAPVGLALNEDALNGARGEHVAAASIGRTDRRLISLTAGSEPVSAASFDPSRTSAIQLSSAGLLDPRSTDLFSFAVRSTSAAKDTLIVRWDGRALVRLQLEPLQRPIAAGQAGSVGVKAELLAALPSHLLRYQDSTYAPLLFAGLPLQLSSASGCFSEAAIDLAVHDDRPVIQVFNDAGKTVSTVAANRVTSGRWGDLTATGGFDAAVGADRVSYSNAGFDQAAGWEVHLNKQSRTYSSKQATQGITIKSRKKGGTLGRLVVADGIWSFEAAATIKHQEELSFSVIVRDADGDLDRSVQRIIVSSSEAPELNAPELIVDENNLPQGDGQGPNADVGRIDQKNVQVVSRTSAVDDLVFLYGDPTATTSIAAPRVIDANGREIAGLSWTRSADGHALLGGYGTVSVLKLSLPQSVSVAAGSSSAVPMRAELLHEARHHLVADDQYSLKQSTKKGKYLSRLDYSGDITITGITLKAEASNGQFATADADVLVLDDMPAAVNLNGDRISCAGGTKPLKGSFDANPGADADDSAVLITAGANHLRLDVSRPAGSLDLNGIGRLDLDVDVAAKRGFWTFTPDPGLTQPQQLSFDVAVQDRDGDQTRDTHSLEVVPGPRIDRGPSGGVLALNEDALPVANIGPDSPYTSRFAQNSGRTDVISFAVSNVDTSNEQLLFDPTRLARIQLDPALKLSFAVAKKGQDLKIIQADPASGKKSRTVARLSIGSWRSGPNNNEASVSIKAKVLSNLITHQASQADDRYEPILLENLPLSLQSVDQSCGSVESTVDLQIYDDVPLLGVMDLSTDPRSEEQQISHLSGLTAIDRDTESVLKPGGDVVGSWGLFRLNNGNNAPQSAVGLASASGADGLAGGPGLAGVNRWQLWLDRNADGKRQSGELFDQNDAALLIDSGVGSGVEIPDFGRFKFWDSTRAQPAGWAFKADAQAQPGAVDFELTVWDSDGDRDRQSHRLVIEQRPPLQQRPDVNLYLLMDHSISMNQPDPSTANARHNTRLEAQNRLAFLTLEQALQEAGYVLQSADGRIYDFDTSVVSAVFEQGTESLATILEDYDFVDNPDDGQIPGVVNVHAIRYGYLVDYEQVTFSNTSTRDGKTFAENILLRSTPDLIYGNSIQGNADWKQRGLPRPSKDLDLYQDPITGRSNLYSGTEMLGALHGLTHLLEQELDLERDRSDAISLVALFTDGRPERRPWWDHRPDYNAKGVAIPLPKPLGGDSIRASGLGYSPQGKPQVVTTAKGKDQWSRTQASMNAALDKLALRSFNPSEQVQTLAVGFGDDSTAADHKIYDDLFSNQTFDNSSGGWSYDQLSSSLIIPFSG